MRYLTDPIKNTIKNGMEFFLYSFLFGIIVHSQALFFNTDATDSIRAYGSTQAQEGSGRFIGHILDVVFENLGFYQPFRYINVLLYLVFAAAAAAVVVLIFECKEKMVGIFISFIIMSSAVNSGILAFFYVAHMYGLAFFLSVFSAYLLLKKQAVILPVLLLAFSVGIYQAFFPTVILLVFLYQFLQLIEADTKSWIFETLRCIVVVLGALGIYILLNKIYLNVNGLSMSGYMSMGENVLPSYQFSKIAGLFLKSYQFFFGLPFTDQYFLSDNLVIRVCIGFFICLTIAELIYLLIYTKDRIKRLLLLAMVILLPCFINLPMFMQESVGERMSLNWYFVFIVPLIFYGKIKNTIKKRAMIGKYVQRISLHMLLAFFSSGVIAYGVYRNVNIYTSYIKVHEVAENVVNNIEYRIADCEGFDLESEIVFIGSLDIQSINRYFFNVEYETFLDKVFNRDHSSIFRRYATHEYHIITPDDERISKFSVDEFNGLDPEEISRYDYFCLTNVHSGFPTIHSGNSTIINMPAYPSQGCVQKIGDIIVCKLGD